MIKHRNKKFLQKFGLHIRSIRNKKGYSQEKLADVAEIPVSQIARIERGEINPTVCTLYNISNALQLQLKELFEF